MELINLAPVKILIPVITDYGAYAQAQLFGPDIFFFSMAHAHDCTVAGCNW